MATLKTDRKTYAVDAIPSDVKNSVFLGNPMIDNLMSCVIALGTEMWSTKRRLKVVESLLAQKGVTNEMIEQYMPTDAEKAAWETDRDRFIDLAFGPLSNPGTVGISADFPKRDSGV